MSSFWQSLERIVLRQASTLSPSYLARPAFCDAWIAFSWFWNACAVAVSQLASSVPALELPASWLAVQQLQALGQIACAACMAAFSIGTPEPLSTFPQPSSAAGTRPRNAMTG